MQIDAYEGKKAIPVWYRMTLSKLASDVQERALGVITDRFLWKSAHCSAVVKKIVRNC